MKKVLLFLIGILLIYGIFIVEESFRLSNNVDTLPLIIINEINVSDVVVYESIGFKLINKYNTLDVDDEKKCLGQELWLFNRIMLWGWIT